MSSPVEQSASLKIGTVESVSPSEIKVILESDAPQTMALNTGTPHGFPRINGYVLIPNETGTLVGMIVWLGIERSPYPRLSQVREQGLLELPIPIRKLIIIPMGTLIHRRSHGSSERIHCLERGVLVYPTVGDSVLLPTREQLGSIVEAAEPENRRVFIGTSPLASNARVTVDPNKLFGRHLAVLGNTGSGKSCTVAGLIRWSLEASQKERDERQHSNVLAAESDDAEAESKGEAQSNARFIILDPNGEYSSAYSDFKNVRRFRVPPAGDGFEPLVLPAWMWNSQEWCAFAQAAPAVQRPLLLQALREMRSGQNLNDQIDRIVNRELSSYKSMLEALVAQGPTAYGTKSQASNCGRLLSNLADDSLNLARRATGDLAAGLGELENMVSQTANNRHWDRDRTRLDRGYNEFSSSELQNVLSRIKSVLEIVHSISGFSSGTASEDAPIFFDVQALPEHLDRIACNAPGGNSTQFISTLSMRIRMMLNDQRLGPVVGSCVNDSPPLENWLESYIGADRANNGNIAVLDLSLVPSDILQMVIAVIARVIFEATQRYQRANGKELPTVLVLEEAHNFIRRGGDSEDGIQTPAQMCRHTFERIAREGRKFGLGLVLSSQRPSELSPTVLAQCNTFLLHRIVNDQDQELVGKLVPDNLGGLLKELPSLPSRQAILLGWATALPTLVEVRELQFEHRPRSADPKFWEVWTGEETREIDWTSIVADWTKVENETPLRDGDSSGMPLECEAAGDEADGDEADGNDEEVDPDLLF